MFVLPRRIGETLRIVDAILVPIVDVKDNQVLGIDAPANVTVLREELVQTDHESLDS
ncbi:MAG: carbon storage regulator [Planctomycetaceae bacterium]|nr:MAG: carbon storage regulator [Planctomycetaceae bacterium]